MTSRPTTLAELLQKANIKPTLSSYSARMWSRSALSLFDQVRALTLTHQAQDASASGNVDDAYVYFLKAVTIVLEVVPQKKDYAPSDSVYKEARQKVEAALLQLETLKKVIEARVQKYEESFPDKRVPTPPSHLASSRQQASPPAHSPTVPIRSSSSLKNLIAAAHAKYQQEPALSAADSAPLSLPSSNEITPSNLYNLFTQTRLHVLVLDVRPMQDYLQGHVRWKTRPEAQIPSGVVQIEPDWLLLPSTSALELEGFISAFNPSTLTSRKLFASRNQVDLVVCMDKDSESLAQSIPLSTLVRVIYDFEFQSVLKQPPLLLKGGYTGWKAFINSLKPLDPKEWIEEGVRKSLSMDVVDPGASKTVPQDNLSRTSYDYIQRFSKLAVSPTKTPQTTSATKDTRSPSRDPVVSANERFPELEDIVTSPIQRRSSRFDDPFYAFQRETKYPELDDIPDALPETNRKTAPSFAYPTLPNPVKPLEPAPPPVTIPDRSRQPISQTQYPTHVPPVAPLTYTGPTTYKNILQNNHASNYPGPAQVTQRPADLPPFAPLATNYQSMPPPLNYADASTLQRPTLPPVTTTQPLSQTEYVQSRPPLPQEPRLLARPLSQSRSASHDHLSKHSAVATPGVQPLRIETQAPVPPTRPKTIRRSSSPSTSPTTQRFYGTTEPILTSSAPPVPPKPRLSKTASLEDDTFSLSHLSSSNIGVAGLKNLGNSCFLNSIIQCLSGTMPLARFFLDGSYRKHINRHNPLGTKGAIAESYAELIKSMWSETELIVVPTKFKSVVGQYSPSFQGNEQQDSQEFLAFLLDALHEDLNLARRKGVKPVQEKEEESDGIPDHASSFLLTRIDSPRKGMAQGLLRSQLKCLTCGKVSTTFNPFMYLSLPIPDYNRMRQKGGSLYLEECIEKFIEEEVMEGSDAWNCPRCKVPRKSVKRLTIAKLPIILLIHLKRFYFKGPFRDKIETYVEFPTTQVFRDFCVIHASRSLDLTRYLLAPKRNDGPIEPPPVYDLYAVSNHFGGLNGGHYTAQVRNGYKKQWLNFDDSRVTGAEDKYVKSKAAYILFYVQNGAKPSNNWWGGGLDASKSRI